MRRERLSFILLAFYLVLLGGSGYYYQLLPVRIFHHLIMTLLLGLWLLRRIRRGTGLPPTALNLALYGLVVIWFISALFSLDPRMGFENLWFPLTHLVIFFVIVDMFQRGRARLVMDTLFLVAAAVVMISALQVISAFFGLGIVRTAGQGWINFLGAGVPMPLDDMRIWLPLGVSTWVAGFVAPLIPITAAWALTVRARDQRMVLWGLFGGLVIVLILTFSRGGLVSVVVSTGLLTFFRLSHTAQAKRLLSSRLVPFVIGGVAVVGLIAMIILSIGTIPGRQSGDAVRVDLWRSAGEMILDDPLTGVGPGLYGRALREYRTPELARDRLSSAHNAYLNAAAETGLPTILIGIWIAALLFRAWWAQRAAVPAHYGRRLRLEGMFAALIGLGVHSLFDTFTITANILSLCVIVAYCVVPLSKSRLTAPPKGHLLPAVAGLVIFLVYGVWFIPLDMAQARFQNSLRGGEDALTEAQAAVAIDPGLHLYSLQVAYLTGLEALDDPAKLDEAIGLYETVLALEPTWDTGWINLAGLYELRGDSEAALGALERARAISPFNAASLNWARLAEQNASTPPDDIRSSYVQGMRNNVYLPLSPFWTETELRRASLSDYVAATNSEIAYRVTAAHQLSDLESLVPAEPQTAAEWWVVGEYALTVDLDSQRAAEAFSEAIRLNPTNGDYYASRARALLGTDADAAQRDLNTARFLGTRYEYPNAIEVQIAASEGERQRLRINALPVRIQSQEFEGVLFAGRRAGFDLLPSMRLPGPGAAALTPYYDLGAEFEAVGRTDDAITVYRYILDLAPEETAAREALARLGG